MTSLHITIDMDRKCAECGKGGAVGNGLCLKCTTRAFNPKPMKTAVGRAVQANIKRMPRAK